MYLLYVGKETNKKSNNEENLDTEMLHSSSFIRFMFLPKTSFVVAGLKDFIKAGLVLGD